MQMGFVVTILCLLALVSHTKSLKTFTRIRVTRNGAMAPLQKLQKGYQRQSTALSVERGSGSGTLDDTSEMVAMSSSELKEFRAAQEKEKEKEKTTQSQPKVKFPTSSPSPNAESDKQLANFSAGSSGFDLGLLIAFPIIVGTLALFFVFPFVGEKLAGGSGTLPPGL